jgi:transposase
LPESWIPPAQILELRTRVRPRKTLVDERTAWQQRLQAQLFHQGVPAGLRPHTRGGREALASVDLSPAGRELLALALRMIDRIDHELAPLDRTLSLFVRRQPGCRELIARLYGVGPVTATAIVAEPGDACRFGCADDAVRHCGLDVTVHQSDRRRSPGHLSHEGPELLRWALFQAALQACRPASPDYEYYRATAKRHHGSNTRSIILSPDLRSAHLGKAGRPRATNFVRSSISHKEVSAEAHLPAPPNIDHATPPQVRLHLCCPI